MFQIFLIAVWSVIWPRVVRTAIWSVIWIWVDVDWEEWEIRVLVTWSSSASSSITAIVVVVIVPVICHHDPSLRSNIVFEGRLLDCTFNLHSFIEFLIDGSA